MNKPNDFDTYLAQSLADLNSEISPKKDLWPGIEKAIEFSVTKKSTLPVTFRHLSVAAGVVAIALLVNVAMKVQTAPSATTMMSQLYEAEKSALLVQFENKPALTDDWQQQLAELEDAELAVKKALKNDPQNPTLLRMLSQVYQQQLDLINRVHQPKWQQI
ncbi:hypothetical protein [Pseudoalteromonas tunicata]|jgi:predicted Zn-dependent protease|uniref:Putative orphan protein n=1 Tax=Pseudoalteromonas tunicata D2 TaxID=87626 RepID=A4C8P9_9GAMM|nr:hypothetical protein [Pseudoalteromonas tunicata]ATC93466.1 hypothetical protein PTUN_a0714 [Pseudoalteromonas tunicata]AXT32507.1 hypothetical protein D1819_17850 [Pseudoalteromonas tunicata]EAR28964.1 putative orphan protein [Pseudoalteromonas tunicata D2]MDP4983005.1 hypothetical protein [Pseudoalteromonas tunicata]MDP5211737.1 hypothetical protein [Pseudoalteromonas tunicata]